MHGKNGHGRHFLHQAHHGKQDGGHGKHDDGHKMGMWQRGRGGKDFRREWQAGGGGYGGGEAWEISARARFARAYGIKSRNPQNGLARKSILSTSRMWQLLRDHSRVSLHRK